MDPSSGDSSTRGGVGGPSTSRQRGILVAATASTFGDSYCSLAWGGKLTDAADPSVAGAVLTGTDEGLTDAERALARRGRARWSARRG